jgi:protocatechuate 3,4-dioxygenase, alpha subunit
MPAPTPSQTVGPFFWFGLCERHSAVLVPVDAPGAVEIAGRVVDGEGKGVPDAMVEIWQPAGAGRGFGRCGTDRSGEFRFVTEKPGTVRSAAGVAQAPHLVVLVFARGLLKPVLTRMYFADEAANVDDPLLNALPDADRPALIAEPAGGNGLRFDIRLQGARQTPFFAL